MSGCRARKLGLGGKLHGMLALQIGAAQPPLFRVHRPATGRAPKVMKLEELTLRCAGFVCCSELGYCVASPAIAKCRSYSDSALIVIHTVWKHRLKARDIRVL